MDLCTLNLIQSVSDDKGHDNRVSSSLKTSCFNISDSFISKHLHGRKDQSRRNSRIRVLDMNIDNPKQYLYALDCGAMSASTH